MMEVVANEVVVLGGTARPVQRVQVTYEDGTVEEWELKEGDIAYARKGHSYLDAAIKGKYTIRDTVEIRLTLPRLPS